MIPHWTKVLTPLKLVSKNGRKEFYRNTENNAEYGEDIGYHCFSWHDIELCYLNRELVKPNVKKRQPIAPGSKIQKSTLSTLHHVTEREGFQWKFPKTCEVISHFPQNWEWKYLGYWISRRWSSAVYYNKQNDQLDLDLIMISPRIFVPEQWTKLVFAKKQPSFMKLSLDRPTLLTDSRKVK
jgi:hypothetical protein